MVWGVVCELEAKQKVKHVVTDSASNITRAFVTLPGFENDTSDDSDDEDDDNEESIEDLLVLMEHHSCFAHILQLVVKDGMEKAGAIDCLIKKCFKFMSFVRKSTIATDILQGKIKLQSNNVTRWNS